MSGDQLDAVFVRRLDHLIGFGETDRHRLLDDAVLAVPHDLDRVLAVVFVRRRNPNGFDLRLRAHIGDRRVRARPRPTLLEVLAHIRQNVGAGDKVDLGKGDHRRHYAAGGLTESGHAELQRTHGKRSPSTVTVVGPPLEGASVRSYNPTIWDRSPAYPQAPVTMPQAPPNVVPGAQSIVKAMMLLELFSTEHVELSVAEAAGELTSRVFVAHRLLAVPCAARLAAPRSAGGPYALGPRVVALAAAYRASQPLGGRVPHMKALLADVDQTVNLYVRLNDTRDRDRAARILTRAAADPARRPAADQRGAAGRSPRFRTPPRAKLVIVTRRSGPAPARSRRPSSATLVQWWLRSMSRVRPTGRSAHDPTVSQGGLARSAGDLARSRRPRGRRGKRQDLTPGARNFETPCSII